MISFPKFELGHKLRVNTKLTILTRSNSYNIFNLQPTQMTGVDYVINELKFIIKICCKAI